MEDAFIWVTLSHSLPVSPSANRVYVWRKLRELGAQLRQGVAILPQNRQNLLSLQQLAEKIRTLGGDATVAEMRFVEECDTCELIDAFKKQSAEEYRKLFDEMLATCGQNRRSNGRTMMKRLATARGRDYFGAGAELPPAAQAPGLMAGLDLDGGFTELMNALRQGYRDLGGLLATGGRGKNDG